MGLRVRKSIKLMPGVRLNISKSGISTSIGVKGATVNLKPGRKARATVGIPGSGLSYTTTLSSGDKSAEQAALQAPPRRGLNYREMGQALGFFIALLGCAFCTGNWVFGAFVIGCGAVLFLACRERKSIPQNDVQASTEA